MSTEIAALIGRLIAEARAARPERPALIGVGGAQGSGKSYHCRAFAAAHPEVAQISLDDLYYGRAQRQTLAADLHPLFITRGPPGTHDLAALSGIYERVSSAGPTRLPRFDKARDEPAPEADWPVFCGPAEALLIDGWCLGATPSPDSAPLNALEEEDIALGAAPTWRKLIEYYLSGFYAQFFANFDSLIYLQAPSWEIVRVWRGQQEEETLGRPLTKAENAALDRFVMHYERITRAMLAGRHSARWIVHLDAARSVTRIEQRA